MILTAELALCAPLQLDSPCCQIFLNSSNWTACIFNWVEPPLMTLQALLIAPAQNQDQCLCSFHLSSWLLFSLWSYPKPCLQSQQPPRHCLGTAQVHLNHPGSPFPTLKQIHLNHHSFLFSSLKQIHLNHTCSPSPHSEKDKSFQPHLGGGAVWIDKSAPWSKPTNFWHQLSWQHFPLISNSQQNSKKWPEGQRFEFREPFTCNFLNCPASAVFCKFYHRLWLGPLLPFKFFIQENKFWSSSKRQDQSFWPQDSFKLHKLQYQRAQWSIEEITNVEVGQVHRQPNTKFRCWISWLCPKLKFWI